MQNAQDKEAVDKVMGDLDSNNDGEVDFTEFIILVGALTVACNDFFLEYNDKPEKKKWTRPWHESTPQNSHAPGRKQFRKGRREEEGNPVMDKYSHTHTHTHVK